MKIVITENHKKKLFAPIGLSGEDSRYAKWNKEQPIKDGEPINQYTHDGKKDGYWEYYSNGNLHFKGSFINGKKDGYWEHYYDNGNLALKGSYVDDKKDGLWEHYYSNGNLYFKGSYVNGKKEGMWEYYSDKGRLYKKELYKNGELAKLLPLTESEEPKKKKLFAPIGLSGEDSRWLKWNKEQPIKDGIRINQYTHDGKKTGVWEYYYENDDLFFKVSYKDGVADGVFEYYDRDGNLEYKGSYKNGVEDGVLEHYSSNGELLYRDLYKNGGLVKRSYMKESEEPKKKLFRPIGLSGEGSRWLKWNKEQPIVDGKPINQYTDDGKETGYWEYYYEDGELASKGSYVNGEKDGIWKVYYSIGKLYSKGSYVNGKREGLWEWYWENGNLHNKVPYNKGKANGVWEWYYKDGKLHTKKIYKDGELVKQLPLTESETPKKKLFRPIDLDKRDEQFNNDIKKFLISIKDSFVWDILGRIYVAYNYETDWSDISYYDRKNQWMDGFRLEKAFNNLYGEKYSIEDLNKALDNITAFMDNLIFAGENIVYGWCEIEYKGDGHLDFTQHKEVKVEEKMMEIKI